MASERDDDRLNDFLNGPIVTPADTGRFPVLVSVVVPPSSERCSTFRRLEWFSGAVAALRKLLSPVLVLFMDRGRSCRLSRTAGRLRSISSPLAPPGGVDEITDSGDRLLRERLKAAMNLTADSGESARGGGVSMLVLECSTNGTSDIETF